jgi:prepilin-type N-terminal cleavage/methylation domain-containing protein
VPLQIWTMTSLMRIKKVVTQFKFCRNHPKSRRTLSFPTTSKAFTLLEIMLVIVILGMVVSVVGWQIASAVGRYAFQREMEEVYDLVKQSQILCLTYRTDISVHFFRENGVFYYQLQTDEPFTEIAFDREKKPLEKIGEITFNGQPVKQFALNLFSQGNIDPRGILGFYPKNKKEDAAVWLDFQGAFLLSLTHHKPLALKERTPAFPEDKIKKFHAKKQENPQAPEPITK